MRRRDVILWLALAVCPLGASGQSRYVSHWGEHVAPFDTWATAATNLVDAIDGAPIGSTIWVSNGVYRSGSSTAGGLGTRVRLTRAITVRSVNGSRNTVIEGAWNSEETPLGSLAVRGVYMTNGVLDGFTIRRGYTADTGAESAVSGGGLYAAGGTQLNIRVAGNFGQTAGGAWLDRCTVSNASFDLNVSTAGARIKINRRVSMEECRINAAGLPLPDLKVLGTNSEVIVNGDPDMGAGNGAWFGRYPVSSGTETHVFTLSNYGAGPLDIGGVTSQGGDAADFEVLTSPSNTVVAPGGTTLLEIRFDPQAKGVRSTLLFVACNDPDDDPYALWLGGEGLQAEMRVLGTNGAWIVNGSTEPTMETGTDFGLCTADPIRHRFAITNAGTSLLTLTGTPRVVIGGDHPQDFTVISQPADPIAAGEAVEFEIEFSPLVATTRTAEVHIYSDDTYHTNGLYQFRIRGDCSYTNPFINMGAGLRPVAGSAMAWGDYDNDGRLDLALLGYDGTNRFTDIYRNLGGGSFSNLQAGFVPLESGSLAWGDYDNDGWLDLAISGMSDTGTVTKIYRNQGDGTFLDIEAGLTGAINGGLAWGDYDNDGDLDLVMSGYGGSVVASKLYRNDGAGQFTFVNHNLLPLQNGRAVWVDVDRSGWLDLILTGETGTGTGKTTRLYRNISGVLTHYPLPGVSDSSYGGLSVGDINSDGYSDLALTGYANNGMIAAVFRYIGGSNLFTRTTDVLTPLWLGTSEWGDLNNNGWQDLVTSGEDASSVRSVNVYANSNGVLTTLPTQIPGLRISSTALGDADQDGDLDMAVSGLSTNGYYSAIFRNLARVSNAPPSAPTGLSATLTNGNEIIFTWDAATDDLTSSNSLTYNLYVGTTNNPVGIMSPHADRGTGRRQIVSMGNAQYRREWHLKQLPAGEEIVWGVQAIDSAFAGGPFAVGAPVDTDLLPDLVISSIQIMNVPFQATVTVSNQGPVASTAPVNLSAWINRSRIAFCDTASDRTHTVGILGVGEATNVVFADLTQITNVVVNTFRAFVNSTCDPEMLEIRLDNNQLSQIYTNRVYEAFWINAVPLTNSVYLRWINPTNIGMQSSEVMLRWSDSTYPATTNDGAMIYTGTNRVFHHTGLPSLAPNFYSIWLTHDGATWYVPPE